MQNKGLKFFFWETDSHPGVQGPDNRIHHGETEFVRTGKDQETLLKRHRRQYLHCVLLLREERRKEQKRHLI